MSVPSDASPSESSTRRADSTSCAAPLVVSSASLGRGGFFIWCFYWVPLRVPLTGGSFQEFFPKGSHKV